VQTKVSQIQKILPKDMAPPTYTKSNPDDQPIVWLALTYDKDDPLFMMKYVRDYLQDRFTTIPGVGNVNIGGYTDPTVNVWICIEKQLKNQQLPKLKNLNIEILLERFVFLWETNLLS
jgi:multidrug efflux pump subunit AcrB